MAGNRQSGYCLFQERIPDRCQQPLKTDIADRRGVKQVEKQRIGRDGVEVLVKKLVQRQMLWPGRGLTAERFRKFGQQGKERCADARVLFQELRHERERAGVVGGGILRLALGLKDAAKIVAGLGMI